MKKTFTLLLLLVSISLQGFAAAKYKPAFYDRAMASIHTPALGHAQQGLPPVSMLAEMPVSNPERYWQHHGTSASAKAARGTALLTAGLVCLAAGTILIAAGASAGSSSNGFDAIGGALVIGLGVMLASGGIAMTIPGIILRSKYGRRNKGE